MHNAVHRTCVYVLAWLGACFAHASCRALRSLGLDFGHCCCLNTATSRSLTVRLALLCLLALACECCVVCVWGAGTHGDGFLWAGATLTFLLGQRNRMRMMDVCYQIAEDAALYRAMESSSVAIGTVTCTTAFARASSSLRAKVKSTASMLGPTALVDVGQFVAIFSDAAMKLESMHASLCVFDPDGLSSTGFRPSSGSTCGDEEFDPPAFDFEDVQFS